MSEKVATNMLEMFEILLEIIDQSIDPHDEWDTGTVCTGIHNISAQAHALLKGAKHAQEAT
jgi:hypothetical protein